MIYCGYWLPVIWSTVAIDYQWYDLLWLLITSYMIYCGYWLPVIWSTVAIDCQWYDLLWLLIASDMIYCGYLLLVIWSTVGIQITISVQESSIVTVRPVSTAMGMNHWARTRLSVIICWDESNMLYYTICYIHYTLLFSCTIFPLIICCTLIYHKLHINIEFCVR